MVADDEVAVKFGRSKWEGKRRAEEERREEKKGVFWILLRK